jgi:hypothetical protein
MNKISFVCTSYRRFTCVERVVAQYHAQTHENKELIIFNTDEEYPYSLGFEDPSIIVVNNGIDYQTGLPYTNRGQICRDAVTHATGDYFMLADDDDIYLPWHMQQAYEGIIENGKDAWKPQKSIFAIGDDRVEFCQNVLEASIIVKMSRIREIGFRVDITGYEGLSWYNQLRDEQHLDENNANHVPSYCFNWSDTGIIAGHKQSGDIDNPNNFENHKAGSLDRVTRPLLRLSKEQLASVYKKYYEWFRRVEPELNLNYYDRYARVFVEAAS